MFVYVHFKVLVAGALRQVTWTPNTLITITSSKYLISYPINMKVSNQVFNTSNSNVLGSLVLGHV